MGDVDREVGELAARVAAMESNIGEIRKDVREVRDIVVRAGGGWRAIVIVASVAAAVGGLITALLGLLMKP